MRPRRDRPSLLLLEPQINGSAADCRKLTQAICLELVDRLLPSTHMAVAGPLLREQFASRGLSSAELAAAFDYDYVADSAMRVAASGYSLRVVIANVHGDAHTAEASFPLCNGTSVADDGDAIAAWIALRIDDYFAPFNSADPRS